MLHQFDPVPQLLKNVRMQSMAQAGEVLESPTVKDAVAGAETRLNGSGRLLIRRSGTEPLARVMAEGDDPAMVEAVVGELCDVIERTAIGAA